MQAKLLTQAVKRQRITELNLRPRKTQFYRDKTARDLVAKAIAVDGVVCATQHRLHERCNGFVKESPSH